MPKLLVLFQSPRHDVVRLADAAVAGARGVRFAEVDLRRLASADDVVSDVALDSAARAFRPLGHVDDIASYDGLILVAAPDADGGAALARACSDFRSSLVNTVGCVLTPATGRDRATVLWSALTPMADRGMILVPAPFDETESEAESARRMGARVAEVIGWVTHARSHHHASETNRSSYRDPSTQI